jgi:hypothetical protein
VEVVALAFLEEGGYAASDLRRAKPQGSVSGPVEFCVPLEETVPAFPMHAGKAPSEENISAVRMPVRKVSPVQVRKCRRRQNNLTLARVAQASVCEKTHNRLKPVLRIANRLKPVLHIANRLKPVLHIANRLKPVVLGRLG